MKSSEFFSFEKQLIAMNLDSDLDSFKKIKERLKNKKLLNSNEFARQAIYVVLSSGFSQKTAKKKHSEIMQALKNEESDLLSIFNNKNKISAIKKLWQDRKKICDDYYKLSNLDLKLSYLLKLPHIGKITANHLARNLGENIFKRDVWIERLLKKYGEDLFDRLEKETSLPRGYIDVVLWKACQNGLIKFP